MDYFKGMTYDDIRPIFEKHFNFIVAFLLKTKEQMDEEDSRALKRLNETKSKDKGKEILVEEPKPLRKQAQIEQDEKYARELEAELNKNIDWDEVIDHVKRKQKEDNDIDLEHADKVLSMQDDESEPADLQEVVEVVTTAKLITEVVTAASATITAAALQLTTAAAPQLTIVV
nr:hypothetical protein [Tanacetum cinerariifolium]